MRRVHYPRPRDGQGFEDLCLDLFRWLWNDPDAQKHGRRGQRQNGVDIFGRRDGKLVGVQCKKKRPGSELTEKEIQAEVMKARSFEPELSHYILATSADRDTKTQQAVLRISEAEQASGGFSVSVVAWQDIEKSLDDYPNFDQKYFGPASVPVLSAIHAFFGRALDWAIEASFVDGKPPHPQTKSLLWADILVQCVLSAYFSLWFFIFFNIYIFSSSPMHRGLALFLTCSLLFFANMSRVEARKIHRKLSSFA